MKARVILKLKSSSAAQTRAYAGQFSKVLLASDVVILVGALGGGKTTFVKGILRGLGFKQKVLSPSFTLIRQYRVKKFKVYHVDLYRLDEKKALDLGLEDFIYSADSLSFIEWGDRIVKELERYIIIEFSYLGQNSRQLVISAVGYSQDRLSKIKRLVKDEPR